MAKDDYFKVTLGELKERYPITSYHAKIRGNARSVYKQNGGKQECSKCGYAAHVDIAHVREVSMFSPGATVAEVNAFENLVALCRNHHEEFDASGKPQVLKGSLRTNREVKTIAEMKASMPAKWRDALRADSRAVYLRSGQNLACFCGYEKHVEVAHVKAIKDFEDATIVAEVNALKNLKALCPNHHWELDHGMLTLNRQS